MYMAFPPFTFEYISLYFHFSVLSVKINQFLNYPSMIYQDEGTISLTLLGKWYLIFLAKQLEKDETYRCRYQVKGN